MDQRTLRVLEFHKVIYMLTEYAFSHMGKDLIKKMVPSSNIDHVKMMLDETTQANSILGYYGNSPMDIFPDIRSSLKRAKIGSMLSPKELLEIGAVLRLTGKLKEHIEEYPYPENVPLVLSIIEGLKPQKRLMDEIFRCIETEDEISSFASNQLAGIRRKIQRAKDKIRENLNNLIRSTQYQKYLQEPIVTIRNNRHVIPVKQEHRGNIPGIIHDQSSSGATLFIEPMTVVEANNELRKLILEEQKEIERILLELTIWIQELHEVISGDLDILIRLDMIFAKAAFSRSYRGICPGMIPKPFINILNGRHPLIDEESVVPITIKLGEKSKSLIITGPNTGGKTVTLKTAGLFVLMVQTGLHIPADYGSEMGIYNGVFADIGDEQSIEQSLSTFSSHMVHIAHIVEAADEKSLVLFDELGAGTDPTEGVALAMAILDFFLAKGTCTLATTHYSQLKVFALTREGMENASMEFDIETLQPTYRLLMGVPGRSNAFDISKRLGLKGELIEAAKRFLGQDDIRLENALLDMEKNRIKAKADMDEAKANLDEITRIKNELQQKEKQIGANKGKILKQAQQQAKDILRQAKEEADNIINEIRQLSTKDWGQGQHQAMEEARNKLKHSISKTEEAIGDGLKGQKPLLNPIKDPKPGESVYISNLNQTGQILSISERGDEVQVQVGIMKINLHISNLGRITNDSKPISSSSVALSSKNKSISMELDLRGQNLEEALVNVDKYLDDVFLTGLNEVVLIHGKGTGVLRNGIHQHLKSHPHVDSYRLGRFGEGESGVTIVLLK